MICPEAFKKKNTKLVSWFFNNDGDDNASLYFGISLAVGQIN